MIIGYARVSTDEQNLNMQIDALKRSNCDSILTDHGISGTTTSRPGLNKALRRLKSGDRLVVWRLDRLGRSLIHLVKLLEVLGKRNVSFQSLTENIDTDSSGGKLVFHMMAALAEFERALISERTKAGIASARASGKKLGRPLLLNGHQVEEAKKMLAKNNMPAKEIAKSLGVHARTLHRALEKQQTSKR